MGFIIGVIVGLMIGGVIVACMTLDLVGRKLPPLKRTGEGLGK